MRLTSHTLRTTFGAIVCLIVAGCGSTNYAASAQSSAAAIQSALTSYNSQPQSTIASTGRACEQAYTSLRSHPFPSPSGANSAQRAVADQLATAYADALTGFRQCEQAARSGSYLGMFNAVKALQSANNALARARAKD